MMQKHGPVPSQVYTVFRKHPFCFLHHFCRSGEEQSHKSPTPGGAVVLMSAVGLSSLFSFILRTRLAYDVSTNLELAS